jgi:hypothetical protein
MVQCPFQELKTFFSLNMANGVSKNPTFHTDFKNVNLIILIKSAPKQNFSQKTVLPKLFVGALFTKVKCIFLKSV